VLTKSLLHDCFLLAPFNGDVLFADGVPSGQAMTAILIDWPTPCSFGLQLIFCEFLFVCVF